MCICEGWDMCICEYVSVIYVFRGQRIVSSVLYHSLPHSFEMGCLTEPEARLGWQLESPRNPLLPTFPTMPHHPLPAHSTALESQVHAW